MGFRRGTGLAVVAGSMVGAGCAADPSDTLTAAAPTTAAPTTAAVPTTVGPAPTTSSGSVARCGDQPDAVAPAAWYRDEPVYVANEQPIDELQAWASRLPGFEDLWIDRDHRGWVALAFSQDAEQRQTDLEREFPGVGAVAVPVPWTTHEVEALRARAEALVADAGVTSWASSSSPITGYVEIELGVLTPDRLAILAPLAGERICISGIRPEDAVPDGQQPTGGDGWRLLGDEDGRHVYATGIATTDEQYAALWERAGMTAPRPAVDLTAEVVLWFAHAESGSCPMRMDDVVVDLDRALVHTVTVLPDDPIGCTDDANPHAYVVAIARDRLPAAPFAIQLGEADPPPGAPDERTVVDADLRSPGSTATGEQIHRDETLIDAATQPQPLESGDIVYEPGYPMPYLIDPGCGYDALGELNDVEWYGDASAARAAWDAVAGPDGRPTIEVTLDVLPARITATAAGETVTYRPATGDETCSLPQPPDG